MSDLPTVEQLEQAFSVVESGILNLVKERDERRDRAESYRLDVERDIDVAREALAPIRELHKRRRKMTMSICDHCRAPWPCATARLVYAEEELT